MIQKYNERIRAIKAIPARLMNKPALTISPTLICPLENTIVLGAVATGNMNPREAASAAVIVSIAG